MTSFSVLLRQNHDFNSGLELSVSLQGGRGGGMICEGQKSKLQNSFQKFLDDDEEEDIDSSWVDSGQQGLQS